MPTSADRVTISLLEPYTDELIVEKTVSDPTAITSMLETFSTAKSRLDHKCGSIGTISFISKSGVTTLNVLPGHNPEWYEFRLLGKLYKLDRARYIDSLVATGISHEDIRLDGHP